MKSNMFGFTLLELIMVMVVVVVAGVIVGARLVNFLSAWNLETDAKRLRTEIKDVQQSAITRQKTQTYKLFFNLTDESYDVTKYDHRKGCDITETVRLKNNVDLFSAEFTNNTVYFDYFGAPSDEGGDIVLKDTKGNTSTVSIASATGRVTIQ